MFKQCPYCQQQVPVYEWAMHEMKHRAPTPPSLMGRAPGMGQSPPLAAPAAAQPANPLQQAAAKAPRIYHHPRCGHATALPDAAVYAQLQDPFSSTSDQAYCSGCKGYVASSELFWEGTSESLLSTDRRRKADFIRMHALNPSDFVWDSTGPVRRKSQTNWGVIVGVGIGALALVFLLGVGVIFAVIVAAHRTARRAPAAPAMGPGAVPMVQQPVGGGAFPQSDFDVRIRQDDIFKKMREQQNDIQQRHDKMMKDLQDQMRTGIPDPPDFGPSALPSSGIPGFPGGDPAADAHKRIEEMQQESKRRMDEMRQRSQERHEEMRKRLERSRPQFP